MLEKKILCNREYQNEGVSMGLYENKEKIHIHPYLILTSSVDLSKIFGNIVVDIYYTQKENDNAVDFYERLSEKLLISNVLKSFSTNYCQRNVKGVIRLSQALSRTILGKSCVAVIFSFKT